MEEYMMQPPPQPVYQSNQMQESSTIAEMRWKDNEFISYVEEVLGGYREVINKDGVVERIKPDYFISKVNDEGLSGIVSYLRAHLNPSIVLSNFDEKKANLLIKIQLIEFAKWITYNQERFAIRAGDLQLIQSLIRPLIVSQIYRSVGGHETKNFHTQSLEHNVQQHSTMNNGQQGFMWPFSKRR